MTNFVERCDAREFRQDILSLFARNGSKMSAPYFDWYYGRNGSSTVLSWVLRGSAERSIGGLCSVIPRTFRFGDRLVRVGVVGNLIVDTESRAIGGPALLRSVQSSVSNKQFDILLGMPTLGAPMRLILRMGFRTIAAWQTFVQIFRSRTALYARYGAAGVALSPLVDFGGAVRRLFSSFRGRCVSNVAFVDLTHDQVACLSAESWPLVNDRFLPDLSGEMIEWQFLRRPLESYRVIGILDRPYKRIVGLLVVDCSRGRMIICHCRTDLRRLSEPDAIMSLCHDTSRDSELIGVITLRGSTLSGFLERSAFIALPPRFGGEDHSLIGFWRPDHPLAQYFSVPYRWNVFPGFNDV